MSSPGCYCVCLLRVQYHQQSSWTVVRFQCNSDLQSFVKCFSHDPVNHNNEVEARQNTALLTSNQSDGRLHKTTKGSPDVNKVYIDGGLSFHILLKDASECEYLFHRYPSFPEASVLLTQPLIYILLNSFNHNST